MNTRYRLSKEYVCVEVEGDYILVPTTNDKVMTEKFFVADEVAKFIIKLIQDNTTIEDIALEMTNNFEVSDDAYNDICYFCKELLEKGILKSDV